MIEFYEKLRVTNWCGRVDLSDTKLPNTKCVPWL